MTQISQERLEEIEEGLGYTFSQSEATHFRKLVMESRKKEVIKILEYYKLSSEDAEAFYHYIKKKVKGDNLVWREIDKALVKESETYLFRYGNHCVYTMVFNLPGKEPYIFFENQMIEIEKVHQVWIGEAGKK
jgi:hypothetical protein